MNRLIIGLTVMIPLLPAGPGFGQERGRPEFDPRRVVPQIRPILDPPNIPAGKVSGQVVDNELVVGVVVEGKARAYPINMLTGPRREIVNDTLGGRAIAATW